MENIIRLNLNETIQKQMKRIIEENNANGIDIVKETVNDLGTIINIGYNKNYNKTYREVTVDDVITKKEVYDYIDENNFTFKRYINTDNVLKQTETEVITLDNGIIRSNISTSTNQLRIYERKDTIFKGLKMIETIKEIIGNKEKIVKELISIEFDESINAIIASYRDIESHDYKISEYVYVYDDDNKLIQYRRDSIISSQITNLIYDDKNNILTKSEYNTMKNYSQLEVTSYSNGIPTSMVGTYICNGSVHKKDYRIKCELV